MYIVGGKWLAPTLEMAVELANHFYNTEQVFVSIEKVEGEKNA